MVSGALPSHQGSEGELRMLVRLGTENPAPDDGLAGLALGVTAGGLVMLLVSPVVRLMALQMVPLRVTTMWQLLQQARRLSAAVRMTERSAASEDAQTTNGASAALDAGVDAPAAGFPVQDADTA